MLFIQIIRIIGTFITLCVSNMFTFICLKGLVIDCGKIRRLYILGYFSIRSMREFSPILSRSTTSEQLLKGRGGRDITFRTKKRKLSTRISILPKLLETLLGTFAEVKS